MQQWYRLAVSGKNLDTKLKLKNKRGKEHTVKVVFVDTVAFVNVGGGIKVKKDDKAYWKMTLRLLGIILVIWIFVSLGLSILLAQQLNVIKLGGYPLGFWFAQQGSIYTFIALIFIYVWIMNKIDRKFDVHEE